MADNQMISRPKLGLFQRIRKFFLLRNLSTDKYQKAPQYLKDDPDVIETFMSINKYRGLEYLSEKNALDYLSANPETIKRYKKSTRDYYLDKMPELFSSLDMYQQATVIFIDQKLEYFKQLPTETQKEFLLNGFRETFSIDGNIPSSHFPQNCSFKQGDDFMHREGRISGTLDVKPGFFYDRLDLFDESVLFEVVAKYSKDYNDKYMNSKDKKKQEAHIKARQFFNYVGISKLPVELQLKLALLDNRLTNRLSSEALEKFVGGNPLLLDLLPDRKKAELLNENPRLIAMSSSKEKQYYLENPKFRKYIPGKDKSFYSSRLSNITYDEVIEIATVGNENMLRLSYITDSVKNPDLLWDVAQTIPQSLGTHALGDHAALYKNDHVKKLLLSKIKEPKIVEAIERSNFFNYGMRSNFEEKEKQLAILKVLTDEKAIERCNPDKIAEFIKNPEMSGLRQIIIDTYGEHAKKILESRPDLAFDNIPNLRIFDEIIYENFGEGVIHNQLTYDSKFPILLADFANHPEKIEQYKKYERLTDGLFEPNVAGNEAKFKAYVELSHLISSLDENEMTPDRIYALKLAISDLDFAETRTIPLDTIEDLDNYVDQRNRMYDDAAKKTSNSVVLKDILSRRIFGMKYEHDISSNYRASTLSLDGMLHYYSVDNLLGDKRTHESDLFTEDELDMLELARIINSVNDPKVLSQIYKTLSTRENMISPVEMQSIKQKIPLQYSRELVSQLLAPEKAREMAEKGEEGISIEQGEDGVDVINLHGADFKIMMHTMMGIEGGLNNNSGIHVPEGKSPEEVWKFFENGCSTISSCLIEPDMLDSCGYNDNLINVGFCSIDPKLIIGMSHHDAQVSHQVGDPDPNFGKMAVKMNYPEELLRKTAAQITGQESSDQGHKYNEVTSFRREQDPEKITSESHGGRIMPDYIIVYGKSDVRHRNLAKAFAKNGKPIPIIEIDRDVYCDRKARRAQIHDTEHEMNSKDDSELVESVKKLTESDGER